MIALALLAALQLHTAAHHPMQYWLSLPQGWEKGHSYPVALVIESANRDFKANAEAFEKARGNKATILVAPLVVTNGGPNARATGAYPYDAQAWNRIDADPWKFDEEGIEAIIHEVHQRYGGVEQVSVTGWEAGCHTVWALLFSHPELIGRAALVCPNYAGRWLPPSTPAHRPVPIEIIAGADDPAWKPGAPLYDQTQRGLAEAKRRGFTGIHTTVVPGQGHGPLPEAVLQFFAKG